jgi:hypothetical protein
MWSELVHFVTNWPWSTIAAFAAAAAAVSVARSETKERATRLGQEAVVEINTRSMDYHKDVLDFFSMIRAHLKGQITADELNKVAYPHLTRTVTTIDRHLKFARMACNDFQMQIHIAEAESHIYELLELVDQRELPDESQEQSQLRLRRIIDQGLVILTRFSAASEAFVSRGFKIYSPRRGVRYRLAHRRWDRAVEAERKRLTQRQDD